jgi:hypothetical protein
MKDREDISIERGSRLFSVGLLPPIFAAAFAIFDGGLIVILREPGPLWQKSLMFFFCLAMTAFMGIRHVAYENGLRVSTWLFFGGHWVPWKSIKGVRIVPVSGPKDFHDELRFQAGQKQLAVWMQGSAKRLATLMAEKLPRDQIADYIRERIRKNSSDWTTSRTRRWNFEHVFAVCLFLFVGIPGLVWMAFAAKTWNISPEVAPWVIFLLTLCLSFGGFGFASWLWKRRLRRQKRDAHGI